MWLSVTKYKMKLDHSISLICGKIIISSYSIKWMTQMTSFMFCFILEIIMIPLLWLRWMIWFVPLKSSQIRNHLDMMAWCQSILSMLHIVCMSWWQLSYRLWSNIGFSLNNLWKLCLFPYWKIRTVTLQQSCIVYGDELRSIRQIVNKPFKGRSADSIVL